MITIVFATLNPGKVHEVGVLLEGLPARLLGPADVGVHALPDETGSTFLENALLKARHVHAATGLTVLADDSGLEVAALGGEPGVRSARFGGIEHDHARNIRHLLAALSGVADRRARFLCTLVLVPGAGLPPLPTGDALPPGVSPLPDGIPGLVAVGEVTGEIIDTPRGTGGFGYDPIFLRPDLGRTFAEIHTQDKNGLSHRGVAIGAMRPVLDRLAREAATATGG